MNKGFSLPILIFVLLLLVSVPGVVWFLKSQEAHSVKGTSIQNKRNVTSGFGVTVVSNGGTWEMFEYLCKSYDECVEGATSGERFGTVNGAKTESSEVLVDYSYSWDTYEYVKIFVRPTWRQANRVFIIKSEEEFLDGVPVQFDDGGVNIHALLIPVSVVRQNFVSTVTFTDSD